MGNYLFDTHRGSIGGFLFLQYSSGVTWQPSDLQMSQHVVSIEFSLFCFKICFISDLAVARNDSCTI